MVHKKTCKYVFMTLTCQAEDDFVIFVGLNGSHCGIELGQTPISYNATFLCVSRGAVCQIWCLYSYLWPQSDNICECTRFKARKLGFWPPETKRPKLRMVIMNFRWPNVSDIRKY